MCCPFFESLVVFTDLLTVILSVAVSFRYQCLRLAASYSYSFDRLLQIDLKNLYAVIFYMFYATLAPKCPDTSLLLVSLQVAKLQIT